MTNIDQKEKDEKRIDKGKKRKNDNKRIIRNDECRGGWKKVKEAMKERIGKIKINKRKSKKKE